LQTSAPISERLAEAPPRSSKRGTVDKSVAEYSNDACRNSLGWTVFQPGIWIGEFATFRDGQIRPGVPRGLQLSLLARINSLILDFNSLLAVKVSLFGFVGNLAVTT
jgi:hypothetical protein